MPQEKRPNMSTYCHHRQIWELRKLRERGEERRVEAEKLGAGGRSRLSSDALLRGFP